MNIHSTYLAPEEAERIENAVRRGVRPEAAPKIGRVDIVPARHDNRTIEVSFSIPALGEYRALKFGKDEQSSQEIEQRVRERLADL
jgi:hypothetical protein